MTPILVPDTCALLDLIRATHRQNIKHAYCNRAKGLLQLARATPPTLTLLTCDVIIEEFHRNVVQVRNEADSSAGKLYEAYEHFLKVHEVFAGAAEHTAPTRSWFIAQNALGSTLASDLISASTSHLATDDDHTRATRRVRSATPPSKRGKDSTADCIVTEFVLRLAATLPAPAKSVVFLSSNTADYCDGSGLIPQIQTEFDAAGVRFARNWGEAWSQVNSAFASIAAHRAATGA